MNETAATVSTADANVIEFESGLFGFPHLKLFIIGEVPGGGDIFKQLLSVEQPDVGFTLAMPNVFFPDYLPAVSEEDLKALEAGSLDDVVIMVIVTVPRAVKEATVNLRAPLLFNPYTRKARQVILADERYAVRQRLFKG